MWEEKLGWYLVRLSKEKERFLDLYLTVRPLRKEHRRRDYPNLVVNNFIGSMLAREDKFKEVYKEATGEEWK